MCNSSNSQRISNNRSSHSSNRSASFAAVDQWRIMNQRLVIRGPVGAPFDVLYIQTMCGAAHIPYCCSADEGIILLCLALSLLLMRCFSSLCLLTVSLLAPLCTGLWWCMPRRDTSRQWTRLYVSSLVLSLCVHD